METTPQQTTDKAREGQARTVQQLEQQARASLGDLNTRVTTFIRERPGTCLIGALAVGYVIGKLAARR